MAKVAKAYRAFWLARLQVGSEAEPERCAEIRGTMCDFPLFLPLQQQPEGITAAPKETHEQREELRAPFPPKVEFAGGKAKLLAQPRAADTCQLSSPSKRR